MTEELYAFDAEYRARAGVVCGVDEAGRGPLCGPVCVAAVILDPAAPVDGVNDSKKLSEKKRELLYPQIIEKALAYKIVQPFYRLLTHGPSINRFILHTAAGRCTTNKITLPCLDYVPAITAADIEPFMIL